MIIIYYIEINLVNKRKGKNTYLLKGIRHLHLLSKQ